MHTPQPEVPVRAPEAPPAATLLVVDDEMPVLKAMKRLFRPEGYQVLTANSAADGLAMLDAVSVDMVLSDIRMPGMDGVAFLETVAERWPDPFRIVLTGMWNMEQTVAAINRGHVYGYVAKPWDDVAVRLMVRHALEQRHLEAERRHLTLVNDRMTRLLDASADQFWVLDAETLHFVQANRAARVAFGAGPAELPALSPLERLPELTEDALRRRLAPLLEAARGVVPGMGGAPVGQMTLETVFTDANGLPVPVEISADAGEPAERPVLFVAVRDVTDRRQWEEEMETYAGTLEWVNQRLHAIRAELEARNAELERHARHVGDVLADPLRDLVEGGRDLKGQLDGMLTESAGRSLRRVVEAAARMGDVVGELMTLPAAIRPHPERGPVDLAACAQDAVVALRDAAGPGTPEGAFDPVPEVTIDPLPSAAGDRRMLTALFRNLVAGALRLAVDPKRPRIHVGMEARPGGPVFFVRGNGGGTGMDAAASMLAPPGLSARPVSEAEGDGEDGLARCRTVVARHGGTIWVESHPTRGTGFLFTLEGVMGQSRPARPAQVDQAERPGLQGPRGPQSSGDSGDSGKPPSPRLSGPGPS
jgi:CheY-like chemotaxis protein